MKFAAKIYAGNIYVGKISANSFSTLKRLASAKCNRYYKPLDTMTVYHANDKDVVPELRYTRINKLVPNNTIVRGTWG